MNHDWGAHTDRSDAGLAGRFGSSGVKTLGGGEFALVTNGLGSFAKSTAAQANNRRDNGLLLYEDALA